MLPDHLCEEGLAYGEDIEIPFHVIFSFSTILIFLYGIHLNRHFYFFGLTTRIFLWTHNFLSGIYHVLFYWYFILHFNHCMGHMKTTPDSTKRLGKVDNTSFDKLYYLAENCTDCYYTSVIKIFMEIIKQSVTDCQIVLVNTARALKYLEDFGQRQSQLFKVLEKYHHLLDNFKNLQLQFGLLKQATSKNTEHLQQAINVQQTCTATICTYINNILPHITKLEQTILQLQQKITMEQDTVQINAPDFDLDIDGPHPHRSHTNTVVVSVQEHFTPSESEVLDATESQAEDDTAGESSNFIYNNSEESHGYENFSQDIQNHTTAQNQITPEYTPYSEEIPKLEEDWDNGQFADAKTTLITRHNTYSESERIRRDYTQQLLDLSDIQYYEEETPVNQLQYSSPNPDYYSLPIRRSQKAPIILMVTTLHHLIQQMYSADVQ